MGVLGALGKGFKGLGKGLAKGGKVAGKGALKLGKFALLAPLNMETLQTALGAYTFVSNIIFKHHVNNELDLIQLQNDGIEANENIQFAETKAKIDGEESPEIQKIRTEAENKLAEDSLKSAAKEVASAEGRAKEFNNLSDEITKVRYEKSQEIEAIKLELANVEDAKNEALDKLFIKQGFVSTLKSISSLAKMMDRSLRLETRMEAILDSMHQGAKIQLEEEVESKRNELELKKEEIKVQQEAQLKTETERSKISTALGNIQIKLKEKKEQIDKQKNAKVDNPLDALIEFAGNTAFVAALAQAMLPMFLSAFHPFDEKKSEEEEAEQSNSSATSSVIDSLFDMFNGIDFSHSSGSIIQDIANFGSNLVDSAKRNISDMAELGGEFLGPAGAALGGLFGVMTLPLDLIASVGIGGVKATKDLIEGGANLPIIGAPLRILGDLLGLNATERYESEIHYNKFNEMMEQNFMDQREGKNLSYNLEKVLSEAKEITNEEQRETARQQLMTLTRDMRGSSEWARRIDKALGPKVELLDEEGQRKFYSGPKKIYTFDKRSPYYINRFGVSRRDKDVDMTGLRMGPLQTEWIKDAYEDIGYGNDAVITSAVRTPEEQAKVNATGSSHQHEAGIAIDLRVPGETEIDKYENGLELMRLIRNRIEDEGHNPKDYQFLVHKVKKRADGTEGALHAHLVYNPDTIDEKELTGDLNIGDRKRSMDSEFQARQRTWKGVKDPKGKVIGVYDDSKTDYTTGYHEPVNPEEGDPSTLSMKESDSVQVIVKSSELVLEKLNNMEANLLTAIHSTEPPHIDVSEYATAPRRGI